MFKSNTLFKVKYDSPSAKKNENVRHPPEDGLGLVVPDNGNNGLATGLGDAGDIVGNGGGDL